MNKELYYNIRAKLGRQRYRIYIKAIYPWVLKYRAKTVGRKDKIDVVFFAINVAMWRYQGVYDLLSNDDHFNCHIVLTSARQFDEEQRIVNLKALRDFFDAKGIKYYDFDESTDTGYNVKDLIDPDILFYPQPYEAQYKVEHSFNNFKDKLLCYVPYYSWSIMKSASWGYDMPFCHIAWKIYYATNFECDSARRIALNHGRNCVVSGFGGLERYLNKDTLDVWKIKDHSIRRLIWAPHFTIESRPSMLGCRSNFLRMSRFMLEIADTYRDKIQIAFKPHPWLKSVLYEYPDWGREVTDNYYNQWATGVNTQLETGDFVDLFKTSDAMIHDSASFTAEYLCVNKPVAFVTNDPESLMDLHNEFGQLALKQHYILKTEEDVISFIDDVVIGGNDTKAIERTDFFNSVLRSQEQGSISKFIVEDIKRGLGLKR